MVFSKSNQNKIFGLFDQFKNGSHFLGCAKIQTHEMKSKNGLYLILGYLSSLMTSRYLGSVSHHLILVNLWHELAYLGLRVTTSLSACSSNKIVHVSNKLVSKDEKQTLTLARAHRAGPRIFVSLPSSQLSSLQPELLSCWHKAPFLTINCLKCCYFRCLCKKMGIWLINSVYII